MLQLFSPCSDHLVTVLLLLLFFFGRVWRRACSVMFLSFNSCFEEFLGAFFFNETFEC